MITIVTGGKELQTKMLNDYLGGKERDKEIENLTYELSDFWVLKTTLYYAAIW